MLGKGGGFKTLNFFEQDVFNLRPFHMKISSKLRLQIFSACMSSPATCRQSAAPWSRVFNWVRGKLLIDLIFLFSDSFIFPGLRRRSLGLFKTNYSSALLGKISKECNDAALVVKR